jgi:hypothetical protein
VTVGHDDVKKDINYYNAFFACKDWKHGCINNYGIYIVNLDVGDG